MSIIAPPPAVGLFFMRGWRKLLGMIKDKNHKNPLKRMGGIAPGASLPLWPYKSKLLTPKS